MRVVAGRARGRRLMSPKGSDTRPTSDRVREAIFNALGSLDAIDGARVLDLFAGSGALGIEALSRGAASCASSSATPAAVAVIQREPRADGLAGATVVRADVDAMARPARLRHSTWRCSTRRTPSTGGRRCSTPPPAALVVIESDREIDLGHAVVESRDRSATAVPW